MNPGNGVRSPSPATTQKEKTLILDRKKSGYEEEQIQRKRAFGDLGQARFGYGYR